MHRHPLPTLRLIAPILLWGCVAATPHSCGRGPQDPERPPAPDHAALDKVLQRFVDARGEVDYAGLKKAPADLQRYIAMLGKLDLDVLRPKQRLATLINAYNAFTLALIIEHYPLKSIRDIPEAKRWKHVRWVLGGKQFSLDGIEHEVLRKQFKEPRIHFAVNCASIGCPPLRREAYRAGKLDEQLEEQTSKAHRDARWASYDPKTHKLQLTRLYEWFRGDFEQTAASVPAFVARYIPQLRKDLEAGEKISLSYGEYDWRINSQGR